MESELKVNDRVRDLASGATGRVASFQMRRVWVTRAEGEPSGWEPMMVATVRLSGAGMYGEYADIPIVSLVKVG